MAAATSKSRFVLVVTWPSDTQRCALEKLCYLSNIACVADLAELHDWQVAVRGHITQAAKKHKHIILVGCHGGTCSMEKARCVPHLLRECEDALKDDDGHIAGLKLQWNYYFEAKDFERALSEISAENGISLQRDSLLVIASIPAYTYEYVHGICEETKGLEFIHGFAEQDLAHGSFFKDWQGMVRGYFEGMVRTQGWHDITVLGIEGGPCSMEEADLMPQLLLNIQHNLSLLNKGDCVFKWRYYLNFDDITADINLWSQFQFKALKWKARAILRIPLVELREPFS